MKTYRCYRGYSKIPQLYDAGSTGGVATTLALAALQGHFVNGMVVSRNYETFIAHSLEELTESCGSIYEEYPYRNFEGHNLGQIGKPCDICKNYSFKISLFCSHTSKIQNDKITRANRDKVSRRHTPAKCWVCRDHIGVKADISVGDSQTNPKENVLIIKSNNGNIVLKHAMKTAMLCLEPIDYIDVVKRQPYLWRWWRKQ